MLVFGLHVLKFWRHNRAMGSSHLATLLIVASIFVLVDEVPAATAAAPTTADPKLTVLEGVYSSAQAERGAKIYAQKCVNCHLANLAGSNPAPPLVGTSFIGNWEQQTLRGLFSRLRTTMPADNPGTLEEEETVDLIAFLLSKNSYPPGNQELRPDRHLLESIDIVKHIDSLTSKPE